MQLLFGFRVLGLEFWIWAGSCAEAEARNLPCTKGSRADNTVGGQDRPGASNKLIGRQCLEARICARGRGN